MTQTVTSEQCHPRSLTVAQHQGLIAALDLGESPDDNPYDANDIEHWQWLAGWHQGHKVKVIDEQRDEFLALICAPRRKPYTKT